jgi:hypothetical protein
VLDVLRMLHAFMSAHDSLPGGLTHDSPNSISCARGKRM